MLSVTRLGILRYLFPPFLTESVMEAPNDPDVNVALKFGIHHSRVFAGQLNILYRLKQKRCSKGNPQNNTIRVPLQKTQNSLKREMT